MNKQLTMYANAIDAVGLADTIDTRLVVELIESEKYQVKTDHLRTLTGEEFKAFKCKQFPAVTWGGTFSPNRKVDNVLSYSGLICLDLDKLSAIELEGLVQKLRHDKKVYVAFISPSGKGIKVIYRTDNSDPKRHKLYFDQLRSSFKTQYNIEVDISGSDVSRLCFLCYDPNVYYNPDCDQCTLYIDKAATLLGTNNQKVSISGNEIFAWCLKVHNRKHSFMSGNRNRYLTALVNFANDYGVDRDVVESECLSRFTQADFSDKEILPPIRSIYRSKAAQHGSKEYIQDTIGFTTSKDENKDVSHAELTPIAEVEKFILDRWELRYNVVTSDVEFRTINDELGFRQLNENIIFRAMLHEKLSFSLNKLNALLASDFVEDYDPFIAYFESLPEWDGEDHIGRLASYLTLKEPVRFEIHFRKWLVRVVACSILPDFFNKQALILVGETQDSGKSTFCRFNCPPALESYQTEFFSDDKDGNIALAENLLIILDELSSLDKAEINALKSLFSRQAVKVRHPFGRRVKRSMRRASFIGSTNSMEFLNDETGSVRWLCFELLGIDWAYRHEVNMDDVYAQAYALFKSDEFDYTLPRRDCRKRHS